MLARKANGTKLPEKRVNNCWGGYVGAISSSDVEIHPKFVDKKAHNCELKGFLDKSYLEIFFFSNNAAQWNKGFEEKISILCLKYDSAVSLYD